MTDPIDGGQAIIDAVARHGIDTVFGLPGAQTYPLFDALYRRQDKIRTFACRHEQAAAYMAFGYARSTGRPSVYSVVPGPGVLNTSAALATALGCNTPILCLTGQVPSTYLGRGRGHLHELPDQRATLRSFVKWADRVERPEDAPRVVDEAFRSMLSGRPGPAAIEMCWDAMSETAPVTFADPAAPVAPPELHIDAINDAAQMIASAKTPMILVGSGAQHASAEVTSLAEFLGAPVAAFRGGRGVVSERHPLGISSAAAYELWPSTDLLIGIGSRLELPYMRWIGMMRRVDRAETPRLIRIDIDPTEMDRLTPHLGIVGDAAAAVRALSGALEKTGRETESDPDRIAGAKATARRKIEVVQPEIAYLDTIRDVLPGRRFLRRGAMPGRLRFLLRFSGLGAANLRVGGISGHARLRISHRARRQGRASGQSRGLDHGRWRFAVFDPRACHRGAIWHRRCGPAV